MAFSLGGLNQALNQELFDLPRLSPAHDIVPQGPFRLRVVRWMWAFWFRVLSPGGRYFFAASFLFAGYGTVSLEAQTMVPFAYALSLWIVALCIGRWLRPLVGIKAQHPPRIAAGESLVVDVDVTNQQSRTLMGATLVAHRLPDEIDLLNGEVSPLPPIAPKETVRVELKLHPRKRGSYRLYGYRVESDFPFGLLYTSRIREVPSRLLVYPKFEPIDRLDLPQGKRYQPGGVAFVSARGESVEYIGNRDYREGDNVRDIDWRATARLSRPIVREFREEYFLRAAVILDTHVPKPSPERCADFERAVSLCAACGDAMNRADYLVDLLAAGPNLYHLLAGRGLASTDQMLDILACVDSTPTAPWPTLAPAMSQTLEQITSCICIFLDWDEERREFATELASSGVAVKVVVVRDAETSGPPTLDPFDSWPGEVPVFGIKEWEVGIRQL